MMPAGYRVRLAHPDDVTTLPQVEGQAAQVFSTCLAQTGLTAEILAQTNSVEDFEQARQAGRLWVAVNPAEQPIGFALVIFLGDYAHLDELDVLPDYGEQGIGSALVAAVCDWAQAAGYAGVTLRTFRDVPWNAPFYQRRGFRIVASSQLSPQHRDLEVAEQQRGLRTDLRVSMLYAISEPSPSRRF